MQTLINLGFSPHEARIYQILLEEGSLSIKEIGEKLSVLPNALYRLLETLIQKEFVLVSGKHPAIYRAVPPVIALELHAKKKAAEIEALKEEALSELTSGKRASQATEINLLSGRNAMMKTYVKMAKETKKEVLIISIGEPIPEDVLLTNRDAIARGVVLKMIAHKYDNDNKDLLLSWKKMGWDVRHYPDGGFHVSIFDQKKSFLAVNNPTDTSERTTIQIFSEDFSNALREYFFSIWKKADEINP